MNERLIAMLKNEMGYDDDTSRRCPNCSSCDVEKTSGPDNKYTCHANKATPIIVSETGRCNLFSAKRARKADDAAKQEDGERLTGGGAGHAREFVESETQ